MTEGLRLDELLRELPPDSRLTGDGGVRVLGVQQDSRRVVPGDLFVARRGDNADGTDFTSEALRRGAVALLVASRDAPETAAVPILSVGDVRSGLALAAAAVYGHPAFGLEIVGITGTNGKTTTAHLVRAAVDGALGASTCGVVGTVGHEYGDLSVDAAHTTPEADELARVLRAMLDRGATHVAMEVSSIALATRRVSAIRFRVAAFTNLTQDHLDFHGTMGAYAAAKAELFTTVAPGSAVVHVDDPFGRELARRVAAPVVRVSAQLGRSDHDADVAPLALALSERGISATLRVPGSTVDVVSPLVGAHNVENLVVAMGVVVALGLDIQRAAAALRDVAGAPGRLERCEQPADDVVALVDYAHTPDALARVLASVRAVVDGRVIVVFGCGGDRDRAKREPMGEAAARGADVAIVTNDNPRGESPESIAAAVVKGVERLHVPRLDPSQLAAARRGYLVDLDRSRAITLAVTRAAPGDTIVVCGKGHETYQILGDRRVPFDDRDEVRRALEQRRSGASLVAERG